jgi:hypothetical protein
MEIKPFMFAIVLAPSGVLAGERELAKHEILSEPASWLRREPFAVSFRDQPNP